jgi:hypothetical protein
MRTLTLLLIVAIILYYGYAKGWFTSAPVAPGYVPPKLPDCGIGYVRNLTTGACETLADSLKTSVASKVNTVKTMVGVSVVTPTNCIAPATYVASTQLCSDGSTPT